MTDIIPHSKSTSESEPEVMPKVSRDTSAQHINLAFIKNTKTVGIAMIVIGILGVLLPNFIGLAFNTYVGGIFLISAIALAFNAWQYKTQEMSLWFKPFILLALALIIFTHPAIILGVLGLLIAIYFLISGFSAVVVSFGLNSSAKFFSLLSGVISFILGGVVLTNWPFSSAWVIGLIIGVTFLFDGIALLSISNQLKKSQS
jgi:uncharacterized membrane protein HdeD (DUF308 family)